MKILNKDYEILLEKQWDKLSLPKRKEYNMKFHTFVEKKAPGIIEYRKGVAKDYDRIIKLIGDASFDKMLKKIDAISERDKELKSLTKEITDNKEKATPLIEKIPFFEANKILNKKFKDFNDKINKEVEDKVSVIHKETKVKVEKMYIDGLIKLLNQFSTLDEKTIKDKKNNDIILILKNKLQDISLNESTPKIKELQKKGEVIVKKFQKIEGDSFQELTSLGEDIQYILGIGEKEVEHAIMSYNVLKILLDNTPQDKFKSKALARFKNLKLEVEKKVFE